MADTEVLIEPIETEVVVDGEVVEVISLNALPDALWIRGRLVSDNAPDDGDAYLWDAALEQWVPGPIVASADATSIQGFPVSAVDPTAGQGLLLAGGVYVPTDLATQAELDVVAALVGLSLRGVAVTVDAATPADGDSLVFRTAAGGWTAEAVSGGGGDATSLQGFAISEDDPADGDTLILVAGVWTPQAGGGGASDFSDLTGFLANAQIPDGEIALAKLASSVYTQAQVLTLLDTLTFTDIDGTLPWARLADVPATFAPSAHTHPWAEITATPTTLAGYGITDAASDAELSTWAGSANVTTHGTLVAGAVPASLVTAGTFGTGTFTFPGTVFASGSMVVGHTAQIDLQGSGQRLGIHGITALAVIGITRWSANALGPSLYLAKSRGATVGSFATVSSASAGDVLGTIGFLGDDGTDLDVIGARIRAVVVPGSTVSGNRIPTALAFATALGSGANDIADKMYLHHNGHLATAALAKHFYDGLDAQGDSFIWESAANTLDFHVNSTTQNTLRLTLGVATITGLLAVTAGASFRTSALATGATAGHVMIPTSAGAPTGVPSTIPTGQVAFQYDSTNHKLYVYSGAWRSTAALA